MVEDDIRRAAEQLVARLAERSHSVSTAESCTGGLIAGAITSVAGSSAVFEQGFVTYSNAAKIDLLGVPVGLLREHGAVSAEVALAMAGGLVARTGAALALSVTGIAGPGGGSAEKPVGLVYFGVASTLGTRLAVRRFGNVGRERVRALSVLTALEFGLEELREPAL